MTESKKVPGPNYWWIFLGICFSLFLNSPYTTPGTSIALLSGPKREDETEGVETTFGFKTIFL
jgi:hypothetical protein